MATQDSNPILVIRYKEVFPLSRIDLGVHWKWAVCTVSSRGILAPKEVTRATAKKLINEYELVPVLRTDDGTVYDTSTQDFRRRHKGIQDILEVRALPVE